jgi:hypothetical protein
MSNYQFAKARRPLKRSVAAINPVATYSIATPVNREEEIRGLCKSDEIKEDVEGRPVEAPIRKKAEAI